ncbi:putative multidrug resistance protein EmrK [Bradyrhizobium ivorense]|uniref:Multidrug resistance protein EmrK n=2 Tax=Bradyrhizobium ivorense TaxID=2511166 RepID=A0A508TK15_9BRAD|nr:HlyD family secretion protein [Bradyrhizobium ivorense]VIO74635.1 putative multidrug resistance protein EmrK [Bradyrhizobium ivorense]
MDARTRERGPSAEKPRQPERTPEQKSAPDKSSTVQDAREADKKPSLRERLRQHWMLAAAGAVLLLAALIGGGAYWLNIRHYESTDDAFVAARSFAVASKVGGYVVDVPVTDNQHVNAGDLLARIDERDYRIAVEQAGAQVAIAQANIANVEAQLDSQQEQIKQARAQEQQAEAQLKFAEEEASRAQNLVEKGAGTVQRQQQTRSDLDAQQANTSRAKTAVTAAELGVKTLEAQRKSSQASLEQAKAQLDQARLNLQYTNIVAAQSGRVVKLSGAVGTYVAPAQSVMMFVPDEVWITANYKETQLTDMRPGQPVEIRIDAYPERKLTGRVASVQPGSGTAFSLLPAENATGNFVKVVQRVPVKIVVDNWPGDVPVGPGMSVVPWTRVR